jgi:hypothetical protein
MSYSLKSIYETWYSQVSTDDHHPEDFSVDDWFTIVESRVDECVTNGTPVDPSDQYVVDNYNGFRSVYPLT